MRRIMNNKGVTVPLVLIVLVIAVIFGFSSLYVMDSQSKFNIIDDASKKAIEYAEAGYNKYLWHLSDQPDFYVIDKAKSDSDTSKIEGKDIPFQDGYFKLEITKPADTDRFVIVKSTGWTKNKPDIKRTIEAKIRKKQFVHHVYVSDSEGSNIWWTSGDESHGPYHTNGDILIEKNPIFYDTVSYSGKCYKNNGNYNKKELITDEEKKTNTAYYYPDYKVKIPQQPQKVDKLEFPKTNEDLKKWALKETWAGSNGMVFKGRTCIYLNKNEIKIRNGNDSEADIKTYYINDIKNKVIYVEKQPGGGTGTFDIRAGNIFISGSLEGRLTIAAENNIYITYDNPTNWYDYDPNDINKYNGGNPPNQPPQYFKWKDNSTHDYPEEGGIKYSNTTFTPSYQPSDEDYWIREAHGNDMLGLVALNEIKILHYGWLKKAIKKDLSDNEWNFNWRWSYWYNKWITDTKDYDFAPRDIIVHGALFSLGGGFSYDYHEDGVRKGNITLWGNITQKERKPVGSITYNTGYNKKYSHDPRMFYDYPPHILEPVNVGWEIHDWKEIN